MPTTTKTTDIPTRLTKLGDRRRADLAELHELVPVALAQGMTELEAHRRSGLSRDTVRRLNGKARDRG